MNKIGWCDMTWNPVWGCLNNCEYCYARGMAKRFGNKMYRKEWEYRTEHNMEYADVYFKLKKSLDLDNFKPSFLYSQFNKKFPKKPQRIFVGSMSEIYYWEKEWMEKVIEKIRQYPQHTFQFLTKFSEVYSRYEFPRNCWLGLTIIKTPEYPEPDRWNFLEFKRNNFDNLKFVCFEPLLEDIGLSYYLDLTAINWVIVGAETGNRKDKIIPRGEWIKNIIYECKIHKIPVYLKDSLKDIYPVEIKEFPNLGDKK